MSVPIIEQHLSRELLELRNTVPYGRILGLASQFCASDKEALAAVADIVLRTVARDLSVQSRTGSIILHINVITD